SCRAEKPFVEGTVRIALPCELHSHRPARDRAEGEAPENPHGATPRKASAPEKRNQSGPRRHVAGRKLPRAAQRDRRSEEARARAKGSRAPNHADRGEHQED